MNMKKLRLAALALITSLPLVAVADISVGDLPDNAFWYMHADLEAMRDSSGGQKLFAWFEDEVASPPVLSSNRKRPSTETGPSRQRQANSNFSHPPQPLFY